MAYPSTEMSLSSAGRADASPFGLGVPSRLDVAETPPRGDVQEPPPPPSSNIRQVQGQRFSETNSRGRDGAQLSEGTASRCRTTAPIEAPLLPLLQADHLPHFTAPKTETESVLKHFHPG